MKYFPINVPISVNSDNKCSMILVHFSMHYISILTLLTKREQD